MDVIFKDIKKVYDEKEVCSNINIKINKGEFFTFLGPSGCGKTTLLRILAGFVSPDGGSLYINGVDVTREAPEKRKVGMVFQNYALFPFLTVYENIAYGLKVKKVKKSEIEKKVNEYLEIVNLKGFGKRNISKLSGGEQQRVALARTLIMEPEVLLLDEPLSNLDSRLRDKMRKEIKSIQKRLGITTIFVTHDQKEALTMSDRMAIFKSGEIVQIGNPRELYLKPINTFVANFIGDTNVFKVSVVGNEATIEGETKLVLNEKSSGDYISIRPQDIKISKDGNGKINNYLGQINSVQVSGHIIEYLINVNGLIFSVIRFNSYDCEDIYEVNDHVYISIESKAINVLKE